MSDADDALLDPEVEPEKAYVCEDCGKSYAMAMHLASHRKNAHGVAPAGAKKKRGASRGSGTPRPTEGRKTKVKKTLVELADLSSDIRGKSGSDLPADLADVIRRDADQLATVITAVADKADPVKWFVDSILLQVVAPIVGASGVIRWFVRRLRDSAQARAEAQEYTADELAEEGVGLLQEEPQEPGPDFGVTE